MKTVYVVTSDPREKQGKVLLVTTNYKKSLAKARGYLIGNNKELFNSFLKDRLMSDKDFLNKYNNGWQVAACIIRKTLND